MRAVSPLFRGALVTAGDNAARPDFYTVGGALNPREPSYVERSADNELLEAALGGRYCYILTPRQMGKSSLMVRCANAIRERGARSAIVDLTSIGASDTTAEAWYIGQVKRVAEQLTLGTDYLEWWRSRRQFSIVQRFTDFMGGVVLTLTAPKRVVVFIDEIDTTLSLPGYGDDYFAAIRSLYNARASDARLERLSFVLLGVASPSDLIPDPQRTPFNIGTRIQLTDFSLAEAGIFAKALAAEALVAEELLRHVFVWTSGHPYLTQKVCAAIARRWNDGSQSSDIQGFVSKVVWELFLSDAGKNTDGNLQFVRQWVLGTDAAPRVLELYRSIRDGAVVVDSELDPMRMRLKLSGLVKASEGGRLRARNAIYEHVFDDDWVGNALSELRRRGEARPLVSVERERRPVGKDDEGIALRLVMEAVEALVTAQRTDQAINLLRQAQEQYPHDLAVTRQLGDLLLRQRELTGAVEAYTRVAESYSVNGPPLPAIAMWQKIRRLDPAAIRPCMQLGELYARQGLLTDAAREYRAAAEAFLMKGEAAEAIGAFRRIVEVTPSDLEVRDRLAGLLAKQNEQEEAIREYMAIATALEGSGRLEQAIEVLGKGLQVDGNHRECREATARVQRAMRNRQR
jgi:tetratricopeptide (TPR) repeat protein